MDFSHPPRRRNDSNIVPMINVVFLLLIFFLLAARITGPMPFDQKLPETRRISTQADPRDPAFHVGADGAMGFGALRGEAALAAVLAAARGGPVRLYADARLPGRRLVRILSRLREGGVARVNLILAAR